MKLCSTRFNSLSIGEPDSLFSEGGGWAARVLYLMIAITSHQITPSSRQA